MEINPNQLYAVIGSDGQGGNGPVHAVCDFATAHRYRDELAGGEPDKMMEIIIRPIEIGKLYSTGIGSDDVWIGD